MRYIFLAIFGAIFTYVVYVTIYTGALKKVEIENLKEGPEFHLAYIEKFGAYHAIDTALDEVSDKLARLNIPCRSTFGHFFDSPEFVEEGRLRSHVGCVLPSKNLASEIAAKELRYKSIPRKHYIRATFSGTPALGPYKAYPKAEKFMEKNGLKKDGPILEVYTMNHQDLVTEYYFPVSAE